MTDDRKQFHFRSIVTALILAGVLIAAMLCITLNRGKTAGTIDFGEGIPAWEYTQERYLRVPGADAEEGLTGIYATDSTHADYYVYRYLKNAGDDLEALGKAQAERYGVFCQMIECNGARAANYMYYAEPDGEPAIVQNYLFEGDAVFGRIGIAYKTEEHPLGLTDKTFRLPKGYTGTAAKNTPYACDVTYKTNSLYLPIVRIRQFAKDYFTAQTFDTKDLPEEAKAHYAEYAADGWTLEEELAFYEENYPVIRSEIMHRNGLDLIFVGYPEGKMLKVKAIIDCGTDFVMIGVEDDAESFQHMTTAILDSIR